MTTIREMYKKLASIDGDGVATFEKIQMRVSDKDALAGDVLLLMLDHLPDGLSVGEVMEIVDNVKFWLMFIQATAQKIQETQP